MDSDQFIPDGDVLRTNRLAYAALDAFVSAPPAMPPDQPLFLDTRRAFVFIQRQVVHRDERSRDPYVVGTAFCAVVAGGAGNERESVLRLLRFLYCGMLFCGQRSKVPHV